MLAASVEGPPPDAGEWDHAAALMLTRDGRGVSLCVDWLREGTYSPAQSAALRAGLAHLTGLGFDSDGEWVRWYDSDGKAAFPEADFDAWFTELKATLGEQNTGAESIRLVVNRIFARATSASCERPLWEFF